MHKMNNPYLRYITYILFFISATIANAQRKESPEPNTTEKGDDRITIRYKHIVAGDSLSNLLAEADTIEDDPIMHFLREFVVIANKHDSKSLQQQSIAFTSFGANQLEYRAVQSIKDVSGHSPNFFMPDFGSSMTSAIFVRGFGSMEGTPVVGMNVDNVPVLNKNAFDADLYDIERIEMLRGPQGTSTGRNSMMGVLNVYTLDPFNYKGTRVSADYSTANTVKVNASTYQRPKESLGFSVAASLKHTDGFFTNNYDGKKCDPHNSINARIRVMTSPKEKFTLDNVLSGGFLKEGGYPYAFTDRYDKTQEIEFDGENRYQRFNISDGLVIQYKYEKFIFSSITGYQFLKDELHIDPDYSPKSIIARTDNQTEHAVSHEFAFRSRKDINQTWNWKNGLFLFFKHNKTDSPITYYQEGLEQVFTNNLDKGIQNKYGEKTGLSIHDDALVIDNSFESPTFGIAGYHQSEFTVDKWDFAAGLRLDFEHSNLEYLSQNDLTYHLKNIDETEKEIKTHYYGSDALSDFQALPKFSMQYNFSEFSNLYLYAARGHKAGGFNTLLFSDIIQGSILKKIMNDADVDIKSTNIPDYDYERNITYDSEQSWNIEFGGHALKTAGKNNINFDYSLYYIICKNQQILTFPTGKNTGSMIRNADKSRSLGGELSVKFQSYDKSTGNIFNIEGSYGYTHARFAEFFHDGVDYKGKTVPFSPCNTVGFNAKYTFHIEENWIDDLIFAAELKGYGKIYWNEDNIYSQQFYTIFNASAAYKWRKLTAKIWTKNLADREFNAYSFKNLGKHYCQKGKPRQIGISVSYKFD